MMARMSVAAWGMKYTALSSILVGVALGYIATPVWRTLQEVYDRAHPVVTTATTVLHASDSDVLILVSGVKHYYCDLLTPIDAFGIDKNGRESGAYVVRTDKEASGEKLPVGPFGPMTWRIYPRAGAVKVLMVASYLCNGRMVSAKFAEADL